jgi:hypothetical protein
MVWGVNAKLLSAEFAIQSCQRSIKAHQKIKDFRILTIRCLLKYYYREYLTQVASYKVRGLNSRFDPP